MESKHSPAETRPLLREKIPKIGSWLFGVWKRVRWLTDGCYVMIASPDDLRHVSRATKTQEQKFPLLWNKLIEGMDDATIFQRVYPHTFDTQTEKMPLVWLADRDELVYVAVQQKYLDYVLNRYPTAVLLAKGPKWGVLIRVNSQGVKNVTAIIMPVEADYQPADREDWDEVVRPPGLPAVGQGEGSQATGEQPG